MKIKKNLYRLKRLFITINYLKKNFINWDDIIKRAINGNSFPLLLHRNGLKIKGVDNNTLHIFKEIFIENVYDSKDVFINENDVVFDVGANVGIFSLFASKVKGTKIFSFEPHPINFRVLQENIQQNNFTDKVVCIDKALAINEETRYLVEGEIPGGHKLLNDRDVNSNKSLLKIEAVTINSILKKYNLDKIDFLKLDCEGAEGEIINSLGKEGLQKINKIALEFHDNHSILNHNQIVEILEEAGFVVKINWDGVSNYGYIFANKINL